MGAVSRNIFTGPLLYIFKDKRSRHSVSCSLRNLSQWKIHFFTIKKIENVPQYITFNLGTTKLLINVPCNTQGTPRIGRLTFESKIRFFISFNTTTMRFSLKITYELLEVLCEFYRWLLQSSCTDRCCPMFLVKWRSVIFPKGKLSSLFDLKHWLPTHPRISVESQMEQ